MTRPLWAAIALLLVGMVMVVADVDRLEFWGGVIVIAMAAFVVVAVTVRPSNGADR
jgi:membrane-bound ClpP family serine protease